MSHVFGGKPMCYAFFSLVRQRTQKGFYIFCRIVKVRRDTQARPARGGDDVLFFEMAVERHRRPLVAPVSYADNLRLFTRSPRTDDLVIASLQAFAQVIGQFV